MAETSSVIIKRFGQVRIHARDERGLQDEVEGLLRTLPFDCQREVSCAAGRIDFVVAGDVASELKVDGSRNEVMRQLKRYAELDWVGSLILVTTRAKHRRMPASLHGKPVHVVFVCGL